MESFLHVDNTLSIYLDIFRHYSNVGVALQAYLIRSRSDLFHLIEYGSNIRLVKGAYHNSRKVAYQSKKEISTNFLNLMDILFTGNHNAILAIATHDIHIISYALRKCEKYPETTNNVQFQFLKGVKCALKKHLLDNQYQVCEYIPYGRSWLPFVLRRLKERKREIIFLTSSMIK
jgi:proline dehydrogenase